LVDSLLEDLPVLRCLVEHQLIGILRPVELADVRVDAVLPEHAFHAERARLVGDDGDYPGPDVLVAQERGEDPDEGHGGGQLAFSAALELCLERRQRRCLQRLRLAAPARQASAQFLEALLEPPHLRAVLRPPRLSDQICSSVQSATIAAVSGYLPKNSLRTNAPSRDLNAW